MPLIVEDGTGVEGANTYVSASDHIAYAATYGVTVTEDEANINLLKAMDYIESRNLKGVQKYTDLDLHFPADYVYYRDQSLSYTKQLSILRKAENEIALATFNGTDVLGVSERAVKSESFAVFSKTYQDASDAYISATDANPRIDLFLSPLVEGDGSGYTFKVNFPGDGCCHG